MASPDNATDRAKIARARKQERLRETQALIDLQGILASPGGRRWILGLLDRCHVYSTTHHGEATHASAFDEGERNVGLNILGVLVSEFPSQYALALQEKSVQDEAKKKAEGNADALDKAKIEADGETEEPEAKE